MSIDDDKKTAELELDLGTTNKETIELFVEESSDPTIFREILDKNKNRTEIIRVLLENPNTPDDIRREAAGVLSLPVPTDDQLKNARKKVADQRAKEIQGERMIQKIGKLNISGKVKLAIKGNGEIRGILIKEVNKLIVLAVLDNPRITDTEIEAIARNRSVIDDALRVISKNKAWMKSYRITHTLICNPKTPTAIAMKLIPKLKKKDLGLLTKDRNVSEGVRLLAKKLSKKLQV